jgi:hypothetical protein
MTTARPKCGDLFAEDGLVRGISGVVKVAFSILMFTIHFHLKADHAKKNVIFPAHDECSDRGISVSRDLLGRLFVRLRKDGSADVALFRGARLGPLTTRLFTSTTSDLRVTSLDGRFSLHIPHFRLR